MFDKKGEIGVLTQTLLILIGVAALVILAFFLLRIVKENVDHEETRLALYSGDYNFKINYGWINRTDNKSVGLYIERGSARIDTRPADSLKFIFRDIEKRAYVFNESRLVKTHAPIETLLYLVPAENTTNLKNFSRIVFVDLYVALKDKEGHEHFAWVSSYDFNSGFNKSYFGVINPQKIFCGDGIKNGKEECEPIENACIPDYNGACEFCNSTCKLETLTGGSCGDSIVKSLFEDCDKAVDATTCSPNYNSSCVYCDDNCKNITLYGGYCGDDILDINYEICDKTKLSGSSCITKGYDGGTLSCFSDCSNFNYSLCYKSISALKFTSVGANSQIPNTPASYMSKTTYENVFSMGSLPFSISAWVKINQSDMSNAFTAHMVIAARWWGGYCVNPSNCFNQRSFMLLLRGPNAKPGFATSPNGADSLSLESSRGLKDGKWHNIIVTKEGTTGRIYIDGVLDSSSTFHQTLYNAVHTPPIQFGIGAEINGEYCTTTSGCSGSWGNYRASHLNGTLTQLMFFNKALTAAEVQQVYNGAGAIGSGYGIFLNLTRAPYNSGNGLYGGYSFNESQGYRIYDIKGIHNLVGNHTGWVSEKVYFGANKVNF